MTAFLPFGKVDTCSPIEDFRSSQSNLTVVLEGIHSTLTFSFFLSGHRSYPSFFCREVLVTRGKFVAIKDSQCKLEKIQTLQQLSKDGIHP